MAHGWVVRLLGDDGTSVDGRLEIDNTNVTFRPGVRGELMPAMVISRAQIAGVALLDHWLAHRVDVTLTDGSHVVFDHGLRPAGDLARALER
jgi:hypothetical protein